jgi:hypothetical protein
MPPHVRGRPQRDARHLACILNLKSGALGHSHHAFGGVESESFLRARVSCGGLTDSSLAQCDLAVKGFIVRSITENRSLDLPTNRQHDVNGNCLSWQGVGAVVKPQLPNLDYKCVGGAL